MNRLETIVSLIDKCNIIADVGTDHGYVAEMALKAELCKVVIASDINQGPLNSAIKHLTSIGLNHLTDFRLGSGISVLSENEADCVIIAGMGGELIATILEDSKDIAKSINSFVLQPMTNISALRKYLFENDYTIKKEVIIKELHRYYFILKIEHGKDEVADEIYFDYSKYLYKNRDMLFMEYLEYSLEKELLILENLKNSDSDINRHKSVLLNEKIMKMKLMLDYKL